MISEKYRAAHGQDQERRTADILDFERVKALPPGPRPYDPKSTRF